MAFPIFLGPSFDLCRHGYYLIESQHDPAYIYASASDFITFFMMTLCERTDRGTRAKVEVSEFLPRKKWNLYVMVYQYYCCFIIVFVIVLMNTTVNLYLCIYVCLYLSYNAFIHVNLQRAR